VHDIKLLNRTMELKSYT